MKKSILRFTLIMIVLSVLFILISISASAASSGTCGIRLTWTLDDYGTLTISGEGEMGSYNERDDAPWYSSRLSIVNINIGNGVTGISRYAFADCSALISVSISDSVASIGLGAFQGCSGLTSITIPDSVTYIGYNAFQDCSGLTSITIPGNVASIGNCAFYNCSGLTSITISDGVTSIGESAFADCSNLTSITIPDSATSIGRNAFYGTEYYNNADNWEGKVLYIGDCLIEAKSSLSGAYCIKDNTTIIAANAFSNCQKLTSITIPDSITNIGYRVFDDCYELTSITIPDSVVSIDWYAFEGCHKLTSITIPDSVTSIGNGAFNCCSGLTSIIIPDSVSYIGYEAFKYTGYYNDANNWEGGVLYIENCLIKAEDCISGEYCIKDSTTLIADRAFEDCCELTSITIPDSVTNICDGAFYNCSGITSIAIPSSVRSIGKCAFYNCSGLSNIIIAEGVTSIGFDAFCCTPYYNTRNWEDGVLYIGNYLIKANYKCRGEYCIKDGISLVADSAFLGNEGITNIVIPDSVIGIGNGAFEDCINLKSITIPDNVTNIGENVFSACPNLTIRGVEGSVAEEYATNHSINFETIIKAEVLSASAEVVQGEIVVTVEVGGTVQGKFIPVAVYGSNNTLLCLSVIPTNEDFKTKEVGFRDNSDADYVKLFMWNTYGNMAPQDTAKKANIKR